MALIEIKKKIDPTLEGELAEKYRRLHKDYLWIFANMKELRIKYADKYIAVENEDVKFSGTTIRDLMAKIKAKNKQIDDFAIDYVRKRPINLLL